MTQSIGPIMMDLDGLRLGADEARLLQDPLVGGLILFARNYQSPEQVASLCREIREVTGPDFLIAVDQEGGRVQRFRDGFTNIPPMAALARGAEPAAALELARNWGALMALEVQAVGVDFSFAPVLDLDIGISEVIGDRAFADSPERVIPLARAFIDGMHNAGMAVTGKHFPGHGSVAADSHVDIPVDDRPLQAIEALDMKVFESLASKLDAVMPAHVIYPQIDDQPAGFSPVWLKSILREQLGFDGVIFSDDLSMKGAEGAGGYGDRARAALRAGCDMVLVCNDRQGVLEVLEVLRKDGFEADPDSGRRLQSMGGKNLADQLSTVQAGDDWQSLAARLQLPGKGEQA